jgi:hypothetical protein
MVIRIPRIFGCLVVAIVCPRVLGHDGCPCPERFDDEESGMNLQESRYRYGEWATTVIDGYYGE